MRKNKDLNRGRLLITLGLAISILGCGGGGREAFDPSKYGGIVYLDFSNLFTMSQDGSNVRTGFRNIFDASMSSDRRILFSALRNGSTDIWSINADGSEPAQLTSSMGANFNPFVSADGTKVVFISTRDGNQEVYMMNADGSGQTRITNNAVDDFARALSMDKTKIVFASQVAGIEEIFTVNVNGTGLVRLTSNDSSDFSPAWTPDGSKIVFSSVREGDAKIFLMNADGTSVTRVRDTDEGCNAPSFNVDGTKIYYWNALGKIRRMNPDGTDAQDIGGAFAIKSGTWVY